MAMWPISLRLGSKLALAFLLASVSVLGLLAYDYLDDYGTQQEVILENQLRTTEALGTMVVATFDRAEALGKALSVDPAVRSFSTAEPGRLDSYLTRYPRLFPGYSTVDVWDASGQNVAASNPVPAGRPRPNIAGRGDFKQAMAAGEPAISGVLIPLSGEPLAAGVAVPIEDGSGSPIGVVTLLVDLSLLPASLRGMQVGTDQEVFVADETGRLAMDTLQPSLSWEERDASRYEPVRAALSRRQYAGISPGFVAKDLRLVTAARIPGFSWVTVVSTPEATGLGALRQAAITKLGIYLGIVALAAFTGLMVTRTISRPLSQLTDTIAGFGRGELWRRVEIRTGDELQTTAEAFNRMASALQAEQGRLRFLVELGAALASSLDVMRVAELLAERSTAQLGEFSWVCVLPREEHGSRVMVSSTADPALNGRVLELFDRYDEWVAATLFLPVVERGEPILILDVGASDLEEGLRQGLVEMGATSWMVVPLLARGRVVGVLALGSLTEERRFGEEELALAMDLGRRAGILIDNALLHEQMLEDRRRMEELAREAERRRSELDAVIEGVGEGITLAEGDGGIVRVNRAGREIWGISVEEMGEWSLSEYSKRLELSYPDGRAMPFEERPIVRALRGEEFHAIEAVYFRPDSRRFHLLFSSGLVRDEQGRVLMAVNSFADITPIRELEQAREEFVSMVAHDLRSPLTVILGFAGMLLRMPPERHGQPGEQRAVEAILSSAKRLEKMVADLQDASRIEARRLKLELQVVGLARLVPEMVERAAELTRGHEVRVEVRGPVPEVEADPARLEQVLGNLLSNAAKYSFPASEIAVEVEPRPGEIVVSVTNEGQGIPREEQGAIFERFRRTQQAERGKVTGLGLGLYITKGLVESHGGRIWVESEVGKHTIFRFALLVATRQGRAVAEASGG